MFAEDQNGSQDELQEFLHNQTDKFYRRHRFPSR